MKDKQYIVNKEKSLVEIVDHLIIHSSTQDELGIYHGKSGIALFFYHYARYTHNHLYEEFAGDLMDEIFEEINDGLSIDFENGYSGIGWAIQYLLFHKFIEGDANEILQEIDTKIMAYDIHRINNYSFNNGLEGILTYVWSRFSCNDIVTTFDKRYINEIENILVSEIGNPNISIIINNIKSCKKTAYKCRNSMNINDMLRDSEGKTVNNFKLGLFDGYASLGFRHLK